MLSPDKQFVDFILQGIEKGFRIGFDRCSVQASRNMLSALQNPSPVDDYLESEVAAGRVVEVSGPAGDVLMVSRFGVIPKRGQPNQWRLILDLSHPDGHSVNDGVSKTLSSLVYVSVDRAVEHILQLGPGTLLAKVDFECAYRNVPVHPDDRYNVSTWYVLEGQNTSGYLPTIWITFHSQAFYQFS
jgi:hypothetical protein